MNHQAVGRIEQLVDYRKPLPICARCIMLERAIREHKRKMESARNFGDESRANVELWEMKTAEKNMVLCQKCGVQTNIWSLRRKDSTACPFCREPLQQLIELDKCDWSEGDNQPIKEGK